MPDKMNARRVPQARDVQRGIMAPSPGCSNLASDIERPDCAEPSYPRARADGRTPPRVFLQKSVHMLEDKGVDFFDGAKERVTV